MSRRGNKRSRQAEEDAAQVFKEFIETFQNSSSVANKTFVRSGVLYPDKQEATESSGQIYKPKPVIQTKDVDPNVIECARILKECVPAKSKKQNKPKSNLEALKEEFIVKHLVRDQLRAVVNKDDSCCKSVPNEEQITTNLFLQNLHQKVTDQDLITEFGAYGPLAGVKIYLDRDASKTNTKRGFVAFMSRKDAERALEEKKDQIDISWGKPLIELPTHPIYIPEALLDLYQAPPQSGLPFNAQPPPGFTKPVSEMSSEEFDTLLYNSYVKVTQPINKKELMLIHRMVEFVVTEGPQFEAMIMNMEIKNPAYNFLFDYQSPAHLYYRWKVYSILHGDSPTRWSLEKFRMFKGGSVWYPPIAPCYTDGMPEELTKKPEQDLRETQCNALIKLIQNLSPERNKIAEAMVFCIMHINLIDDLVEIILEALTNPGSNVFKRISRLYLLSDVISNCKLKNVTLKIQHQDDILKETFAILENFNNTLSHEHLRDQFSLRVCAVIEHWDKSNFFSKTFIETIRAMFCSVVAIQEDDDSSIDEPLDGASLLKRYHPDIDPNIIIGHNLKNKQEQCPQKDVRMFHIPSKWDKFDSEDSTSKEMFHTNIGNFTTGNTVENVCVEDTERHSLANEKMHAMKLEKSPKCSKKSGTSKRKKKNKEKYRF